MKIVDTGEYVSVLRELVEEGNEVSMTIAGNSMAPFLIHQRDVVWFRRPERDLRAGDIVFYQRDNGQYILHRIVYVNGDTYVMRGDNQWENEYNIRHDQIIGVLYSFDRNGKTHKVTDAGYKIYVKFLPIIRYSRRYYYLLKSKIYAFIKFLTGDRFPKEKEKKN